MTRLVWRIAALLLFAHLCSAAQPGDDWPTFRHDPQLTGICPMPGRFSEAPREAWSVDLGATPKPREWVRLADIDGDGLMEILVVRGDHIVCLGRDGEQRWEATGLPSARITDIRDFAGNGSPGILVWSDTGLESTRWMISGVTGKAVRLYAMSDVFGAEERIGTILPGVPGEQLCAWWSGDHPDVQFGGNMRGEGFLFSFENGIADPVVRFQQHMEGMLFKPKHFFADYDRDGRTEMVMVSHQQAWFFDVDQNSLELYVKWPMIRTYWATLAMLPVQLGKPPSLLSINPHIPGAERVDIVDGEANVVWRYVAGGIEDQYQTQVKVEAGTPDPFVQLDGDGHLFVLLAVTNEHGDGKTWLVVLDGLDGSKRFEEPGVEVLGYDDLDKDEKPELLLREGDDLRIAVWKNGALVDRWREKGAEPLLVSLPSARDLGRSDGGNAPVWRLAPGDDRFLIRFPDGVFACTLDANGFHRKDAITVHAALGNVPDSDSPEEEVTTDGETVIVRKRDVETYRYPIQRALSYLAPSPIVADLGGHRRILVKDATDTLLSFSADGVDKKILAPRSFGEVAVWDMDGDGRNEVVAGTLDEDGAPSCVFADADGRVSQRIGLIENATALKVGPSGSLGPGKGRWLVIYYERGVGNRNGVVAYDGKTGNPMWSRDDFQTDAGAYGENAKVKFVLHIPTAVWDYDGDGADDLLAASENFYGVVSVAQNRDLSPLQVFSDYIPGHWQAYACPIAADFLARGRPQVFHHKAFANTILTDLDGLPIWHWGLTRSATASFWPGIADLDGDGTLEIVQSRVDGLLRAFDATPQNGVCPKCPPDASLTAMNHGGHIRWERSFSPPVSDLVSGDLDGDGKDEVLFGSGDGHLYALGETNGTPIIKWSYDFGGTAGSAVMADLDGDTSPEILVPVEDGTLRCLVPR